MLSGPAYTGSLALGWDGLVDDKDFFQVVAGNPTPAEVAVLVAIFSSRSGTSDAGAPAATAWNDRSALMRKPVFPSPDGWRRSGLR
jgi:hypothetical protein